MRKHAKSMGGSKAGGREIRMVSFGIAQHSAQQQQKSMRQRSDSGIGIGIDSDSSVAKLYCARQEAC
jgi:hypothetical protein